MYAGARVQCSPSRASNAQLRAKLRTGAGSSRADTRSAHSSFKWTTLGTVLSPPGVVLGGGLALGVWVGCPAVVCATMMGHTEVVEALLRLGCDPNAPNRVGYPALMLAAMEGHGGVVGALLEHGGAELDAVDRDGRTALMDAAHNGHAAVAAQLVEAGADATLRATGGDYEGKTALEIAEDDGMAWSGELNEAPSDMYTEEQRRRDRAEEARIKGRASRSMSMSHV